MHCENLEKILNCVKYQKHLIQHDLNEIILLKLENFANFIVKIRKILKIYGKNLK